MKVIAAAVLALGILGSGCGGDECGTGRIDGTVAGQSFGPIRIASYRDSADEGQGTRHIYLSDGERWMKLDFVDEARWFGSVGFGDTAFASGEATVEIESRANLCVSGRFEMLESSGSFRASDLGVAR